MARPYVVLSGWVIVGTLWPVLPGYSQATVPVEPWIWTGSWTAAFGVPVFQLEPFQ